VENVGVWKNLTGLKKFKEKVPVHWKKIADQEEREKVGGVVQRGRKTDWGKKRLRKKRTKKN